MDSTKKFEKSGFEAKLLALRDERHFEQTHLKKLKVRLNQRMQQIATQPGRKPVPTGSAA
jgi:hypothetical protein